MRPGPPGAAPLRPGSGRGLRGRVRHAGGAVSRTPVRGLRDRHRHPDRGVPGDRGGQRLAPALHGPVPDGVRERRAERLAAGGQVQDARVQRDHRAVRLQVDAPDRRPDVRLLPERRRALSGQGWAVRQLRLRLRPRRPGPDRRGPGGPGIPGSGADHPVRRPGQWQPARDGLGGVPHRTLPEQWKLREALVPNRPFALGPNLTRRAQGWVRDLVAATHGVAAVDFAMILPGLLLLYIGMTEASVGWSLYRKV